MPSLPQELVDRIIDEARDDIPTLRSCSLVSHAFLPRTRVHLFETIDLSTIDKCQNSTPCNLDLCTLYGGRRERILEDPSFPAVMGLIPVCQLERLKINKYHWSEVSESSKEALSQHSFRSVVLDTNLLKDVDALYTVFSGSTEFDLSFEGIIGESSPFITNMSPPASGGWLVKLSLEGFCDPILESIIETQTYPFSVNNLQSLSIIIEHQTTVASQTNLRFTTSVPRTSECGTSQERLGGGYPPDFEYLAIALYQCVASGRRRYF
ncbi:uncharacterized protein EV420DRAFT_1592889 [Desarmillaria tabescens]|uniref:Uncharacterized protein n=1 Tax=Armillaria tabescens TaxID=1929756 RepID=A0AA39MJ00_ARMTA|nr:uncharacterized protein EV420DRAFT_1592889 [Desarmillaria tabescens]KAK0435588.1 hypothetical protein EV420DRAFT_1592889 [Desarmillaria tabescens]